MFILIGHQQPELIEIPRENVVEVIDNNKQAPYLANYLKKFVLNNANTITSIVTKIIVPDDAKENEKLQILYLPLVEDNENNFDKDSLDKNMITKLERIIQKSKDYREYLNDYILTQYRIAMKTDFKILENLQRNVRLVWNGARTKCIITTFSYNLTIEVR